MGKTLNVNPDEHFLNELERKDATIAKLQQENAELRKLVEGAQPPPQPVEQAEPPTIQQKPTTRRRR